MSNWPADEVRPLALDEFDCSYVRYRLQASDEVRQRMVHSLQRYGQLAPVVVFLRQDQPVLVDGFKRHDAASRVKSLGELLARRIEADERSAKAAMYGLNRLGGRLDQLEEAWIVQALVREDGLSQPAAAQLLGRHKSWVCRRLALLEKLSGVVREELGLGLVSASMARQLTRLPAGNQAETLAAVRREDLNAAELRGVTDLLLGCSSRPQVQYRVVDAEGLVSYQNNAYSVPWRLIGQTLPLRITEQELIAYDGEVNEVARHPLLQRGQHGERVIQVKHRPADNRREQLEQLRQRFDELGETARRFFEGLVQTQSQVGSQAKKTLALLSLYHRRDVLAAMERAVRYRAFSWRSLERILAVRARPKTAAESLSDSYPPPLSDDDPVAPRGTDEYQHLLFDETDHAQKNTPQENDQPENNAEPADPQDSGQDGPA